jgi:hypothetical protein
MIAQPTFGLGADAPVTLRPHVAHVVGSRTRPAPRAHGDDSSRRLHVGRPEDPTSTVVMSTYISERWLIGKRDLERHEAMKGRASAKVPGLGLIEQLEAEGGYENRLGHLADPEIRSVKTSNRRKAFEVMTADLALSWSKTPLDPPRLNLRHTPLSAA